MHFPCVVVKLKNMSTSWNAEEKYVCLAKLRSDAPLYSHISLEAIDGGVGLIHHHRVGKLPGVKVIPLENQEKQQCQLELFLSHDASSPQVLKSSTSLIKWR